MCKLLILSNTSRLTARQLSKMLKASSSIMGKTDDDGFGWAMLNGNKVVGERCLEPEYFENRFFNNGTIPKEFKGIFETWEANAFGKLPATFSGGLLVHARISTNTISLGNTHPFINKDYAIVHNGIVENEGAEYVRQSTCDSEHILHHLTIGGVEGMVKNISGYYAVGALNKNTGELTVIKDSIARLNACYVPSLDSMAFGTDATQLRAILKEVGLVHTKIKAIKDNVALVFNREGKLVSQSEIKPLERYNYSKSDYYRSMGWDKHSDEVEASTPPYYPNRYESSSSKALVPDNVVPLHTTEPTTPEEWRIRQADDGAPVVAEFDFVDEAGNRIPNYRLDNLYIFMDSEGNQLTAAEFMALTDEEQQWVEILDRATHEPVARVAV
jgi:predicted glutamine amidotransferase